MKQLVYTVYLSIQGSHQELKEAAVYEQVTSERGQDRQCADSQKLSLHKHYSGASTSLELIVHMRACYKHTVKHCPVLSDAELQKCSKPPIAVLLHSQYVRCVSDRTGTNEAMNVPAL